MKRLLMLLAVNIVFFVFALGTLASPNARTVRIGAFNYYPSIYQAEDGSVKGLYVDFLSEIAKRENWNIEYVFGSWADGLARIKTGEVDVLTSVATTNERLMYMDYGKEPLLTVWAELYVPTDSSIDTIRQVKGKKIAIMKGDFNGANFRNLVEKFEIPCQLIEYSNFEDVFKAVSTGKANGGVVNNIFGSAKNSKYHLKSSGVIFNPFDIFFTVAKGKNQHIIETLDKYLIEWRKQENSPYNTARKHWAHGNASSNLIPVWLKRTFIVLIFTSGLAFAFILLLRKKVRLKTSELELQVKEREKTEQLFRELFQNAADPIYISDMSGNILNVNSQACTELGYSHVELLSKQITDLDVCYQEPEKVKIFFQQLMDEKSVTFETKHLRKDNLQFYVEIHASCINYNGCPSIMGVARNIDERKKVEEEHKKLEQQLLHAQKLESLGVLAGGIAHDFNNILTSIIGNADLALLRINKESPGVENLHKIEEAAARAADLAKQMLAYSGKGKFVVENINLNRLLEDMLHMLEVSISKKAVLRLNLIPDLLSVEADATQIRQIVMNLIINASEAIGDKSGVIAVTTGCMECNRSHLKDVWLDENIRQGLYVYLEITDTGCGMDKDTLAKIFDPFFTTKFTGRGLGMAAVLGIVRGHKGAIKVYSEPGKGTTFKIFLPASGKPADVFNHNSFEDNWKGNGTILLVDDEVTVRGIGKEMLKELGFAVITANDGREAVEIFNTTPGISFVILDLTMPHMDGEQCFRELKQLKPDVKVIMSSGFSEHEVTQKFVGKGLSGFVQKPYKLSVLKEAIQKI